jgi:hypothetical protein
LIDFLVYLFDNVVVLSLDSLLPHTGIDLQGALTDGIAQADHIGRLRSMGLSMRAGAPSALPDSEMMKLQLEPRYQHVIDSINMLGIALKVWSLSHWVNDNGEIVPL